MPDEQDTEADIPSYSAFEAICTACLQCFTPEIVANIAAQITTTSMKCDGSELSSPCSIHLKVLKCAFFSD